MDDDSHDATQTMPTPAPARGALGAWWRQGCRSALLLRPAWQGLPLSPAIVAALVLLPMGLGLGVERLAIDGPAQFYWPALFSGWLGTVVALWVCWWLTRPAGGTAAGGQIGGLALFSMMAAQTLFIMLGAALLAVPLSRGVFLPAAAVPSAVWWTLMAWMLAWMVAAQLTLLWRAASAPRVPRVLGCAVLASTLALHSWFAPHRHWYPLPVAMAHAADNPPPLRLTQELVEQQSRLLETRLAGVQAGRAGLVDVYAITFAPYAGEDVFMRESELVAGVMQSRFGADGKTIQLVNNRRTVTEWPWATPLNLERSIRHVAQRMKRDEDILFLHLTSHGARDGRLFAEFEPLSVDSVTPQLLKRWLDEAGVRFRVISVSACYSGSWIAPLAEPGTLVMTAADADHTSYGCGRGSPLTYFGRAMYDEGLRRTWSFEAAHASARSVIERREKDAGKTDGYSNPQISVGAAIRPQLARLENELREARR